MDSEITNLMTIPELSLNNWIRLDARGNKEGVQTEFSLNEEKLTFKISSEGEIVMKRISDIRFFKSAKENIDGNSLPSACSDKCTKLVNHCLMT